MRKNKYDEKLYAKYTIRKIVNAKRSDNNDNDDSGLIESEAKPSVRIIRHTDQNTFTTKIAKSGIEHEQSTEKFVISPLNKSSTTKTKISKLLLKSQVNKKTSVGTSSNKSSKNYNISKPTKAIVKSITTYKIDPFLFQQRSRSRAKMNTRGGTVDEINNDEVTAAPVPTFVTKENEMQMSVVVENDREVEASSSAAATKHDLAISDKYLSLSMKGRNDAVMRTFAIDERDDKKSGGITTTTTTANNKAPVAQPYVNYQLSDTNNFIQKSVVVDADDHENNRNFLINAIKKPAGDDSDEEMSPSHSFVINKSLVGAVAATTVVADNSSKKSLFVMHNNGTNDDDDREKENYHDNGNPIIKKSPYELTQNNFKSMNLNLSPSVTTSVGTAPKKATTTHFTTAAPSSVICPKLLKVSLGSGATNVTGSSLHLSPSRGQTPGKGSIASATPPIDREAAREFIKKQQEQRKAMEIAKRSNNEKQLIKERLEALKKRTRNLVQHNVEKKHETKKGKPGNKSVRADSRQKSSESNKPLQHSKKVSPKTGSIAARKSPLTDKRMTHSDLLIENMLSTIQVSPKQAKESVSKSVEKTPLISRSDQVQKILKQTDHGFVQPKDLLKSNQALGLLRKGDALIQEDVYSPLKIHDATGLRESMGQTFINRSSYNQTFGDVTLDPNATSFIIRENSHDEKSFVNESRIPLKETKKDPAKVSSLARETKDVEQKGREIPDWLQESNVQQYPYNFITALKKKLSAAIEESKSPIVPLVKEELGKQDKYHKMAFVNDKREYESCSFTEVVTDSDQQKFLNETPKVKKPEPQETRRSGQKRGKENIKNSPDPSMNEQYTSISSISSPLQNFSPNHRPLFASKYKHQHHRQDDGTDEKITVTDPNTISEISSLKSEASEIFGKRNPNIINSDHSNRIIEKRQVEGVPRITINPMLDPIPIYDANGNENSSNQRQNRYLTQNVNEFINNVEVGDVQPQRIKPNQYVKNHVSANVKKSSSPQAIDNEILLSHHKSNEDVARQKVAKEMRSNERNDNENGDKQQLDGTYARLLMEFKQSLNNFIDLNEKLQSAVKTHQEKHPPAKSETKPEKPTISHHITKRDDIGYKDFSHNLPPLLKPAPVQTTIDENVKFTLAEARQAAEMITPTKYSSSFESAVISNNSHAKQVVERLSSSSSTNSTGTTTETGYDQSPEKKQKSGGRKSDFYEPQRFEKEFGGEELRSLSENTESQPNTGNTEKSVEEIILELTHANESSSSKSVPIIRDTAPDAANQTAVSMAKNYDTATSSQKSSSEQDSEPISLPLKMISEDQSTSAGDEASSTSTSPNEREPKLEKDDRTDTEIESLPKDPNGNYESEFETEEGTDVATESLAESSILEMSMNESNLNFNYSTVGMVDQMIYTEDMKSEQLSAMIGLRTKSMIDRLKGQISFLEVKKQRCKGKGQVGEVQSLRKKQRAILMKLDQAKTSLRKIVEWDGRNILQPINVPQSNLNQSSNSKYLNLFEKILKSRIKVPPTATADKSLPTKPIKGFEIEPSHVLERLLQKRQHELEARRKKLEKLTEWQTHLDKEELRINEMEKQLLQHNIDEARVGMTRDAQTRKSIVSDSCSSGLTSRSEIPFKSRAIEDQKSSDDKENHDSRIAAKLSQLENSLSLLQEVRDDVDDTVVLTGVKLNKLWFRLSGQKEKKFDPNRVYDLDKKKVSELYEEAKNVVMSQFEDKTRVKQMLEVSKLQESAYDNVYENVDETIETKEGSSTTEASSVLDKDELDVVPEVPEQVPEVVMETDMTLTEENIQKMESLNKELQELQESMNKSSTTPISIEEEMIPEASSMTVNDTERDPVAPTEPFNVSELSYTDTFNNSLNSPPPEHEETLLDNISFPKMDMTTFHNETFIEKSLEKSDDHHDSNEVPSIQDEISINVDQESSKELQEVVSTQEIPEEVFTIAHSATSSSSSSISSKVDPESDEILLMAAISTIKVTPKVTSPTTTMVSLEYKLPDIINEAEVLRRQQMQIEQEIEQLQQQVPFVYLRDIPNKPPPPYTLPLQESKDKFPSTSTIESLVVKRVETLYRLNKKYSSSSLTSSNLLVGRLSDDDSLKNIYERLIIDVSDEFFYAFEKCATSEKQTGIIKNSLVFYNPPNELECLQSFINKKVEKICDPLARDESLAMSSLDEFSSLNTYYSGRRTHKKDLVDEILMQELIEDDPNWTYFEEEELVVKNDLVNAILKMLVDEAVTELVQIIT